MKKIKVNTSQCLQENSVFAYYCICCTLRPHIFQKSSLWLWNNIDLKIQDAEPNLTAYIRVICYHEQTESMRQL